MRVLIVLAALAAATPAFAQQLQAPGQSGPIVGAKLGQLEIKAYQPIAKSKIAVQLSSDTSLSRNLRREVMVRLARRGNEVGFSGGNVMRMDVSYIDLSGSSSADIERGTIPGGTRPYDVQGSNPRPELPAIKLERRDSSGSTGSFSGGGPTLRVTLTLYALDTGKVLWVASSSCVVQTGDPEAAGISMIDTIFDDADKNKIADAGCPL